MTHLVHRQLALAQQQVAPPSAGVVHAQADALLVVGTSMQVYPAAGLVHFAPSDCPVTMVNPDSDAIAGFESVVAEFIQAPASEGVAEWARRIRERFD